MKSKMIIYHIIQSTLKNNGFISVDEIHDYICDNLGKEKPEQEPWKNIKTHKTLYISKAKTKDEIKVEDKEEKSKVAKKDKITILFLPSNPSDESKGRFGKEYREIEENIKRSSNRDKLKLVSRWAVRKKDLIEAINEHKPNIIHISGSGKSKDIVFEDEMGEYSKVSKNAMKGLVNCFDELKMIVFNKSNSIGYAFHAVEAVGYAVGMDGVIEGDKAIAFSYRLYSSLGFDKSIESSFNQAVVEIGLIDDQISNIPKLYKKGIVDKIKSYKEKMAKEFKILGVVGFKTKFDIDGIYIPLKMHIDRDSMIKCETDKECKENESKLTAEGLLEIKDKVTVVLGKPGMGKTTMLRYLGRRESKKEEGLIPIFIKLSEYSKKVVDLETYIIEVVKGFLNDEEWIKNVVLKGNGLILLDGMDEVSKDNYNDVANEIRKFTRNYDNSRVIVTSRDARFKSNLFPYCTYEIDKLPYGEMEVYIDKWFKDIEMENKDYEIERLKRYILSNKKIYELAENPFLLSIICVIYEQDKKLPERRVELYERCTTMLLELYDIYEADKKNMFTKSLKEEVLEDIAYNFFGEDIGEFSSRDMAKQVGKTLKSLDKSGDEEEILDEICENSGILQKSNNEYLLGVWTTYP